ncbi:MAG TPA: bifunctional 5,10-methylenetetrahydrofolate dehydrogenase/5,10-methenyltetrahydrofolate cyclohydrolase [Chloroflexota bacterium]|nr:bifunctional 5,10-methylenetetrahydrofolate dehydrogenase/5,10-methenyltetrahydrofolate cyclohydrolase [Chloroflexota bacterium]
MTARILDGRAMAREIIDGCHAAALALQGAGGPAPTIAVVRVGEDPPSVRYAEQIHKVFTRAACGFRLAALPRDAGEAALEATLGDLSRDPSVNGILLQLPLPAGFDRGRAFAAIDPAKDVDGVTAENAGRLFLDRGRYFIPNTPLGGLELLRRYGIGVAGKHAVVVGRSEIVGRPMAVLLLRENATVTICHSRTADLASLTRQAEILVLATGRPGLIRGDMVRPGAVVIDFGINVVDGKVVGDADFASVSAVAGALTPVPGGTGPMTNAMLLTNTMRAAEWGIPSRGAPGAGRGSG